MFIICPTFIWDSGVYIWPQLFTCWFQICPYSLQLGHVSYQRRSPSELCFCFSFLLKEEEKFLIKTVKHDWWVVYLNWRFKVGWHTLCFPDNFSPRNTVFQSGLVHFSSHLNTLYSLTHFTPQNILLLNTHCSLEYFSPQHTLLHGTLCFQEHFAFCVPESKVCCREHFTKEQNVPVSKVFQGAKCSRKQNVLWSKVFQEAKCSREQNVLRSKMFFGAKYESAKCAKEQSVLWSKVCLSPPDSGA